VNPQPLAAPAEKQAGAPGWQVRRARAADAAAIQALYRQFVSNPALDVQAQRIEHLAQSADHWLLVAHGGSHAQSRPHHSDSPSFSGAALGSQPGAHPAPSVCGTALLIFCSDVMFGERPFAVLENLVVDASLRGLGVGRALLRQAEALCLERSASKLMITSGSQREQAHGFFEAVGYCGQTKKSFIKYHRSFQA
jgi:N-acetylglutamate synthase-like GNAT family acetyltransferase